MKRLNNNVKNYQTINSRGKLLGEIRFNNLIIGADCPRCGKAILGYYKSEDGKEIIKHRIKLKSEKSGLNYFKTIYCE